MAGVIRATMCDDLPEAIEVRHGERTYPVVPLPLVEVTDPATAAVRRRDRQRPATGHRSAGGPLPVDDR